MGIVKYLLDTHTLLWLVRGSGELSNTAKTALNDTNTMKNPDPWGGVLHLTKFGFCVTLMSMKNIILIMSLVLLFVVSACSENNGAFSDRETATNSETETEETSKETTSKETSKKAETTVPEPTEAEPEPVVLEFETAPMISTGGNVTIGLRIDGTVATAGGLAIDWTEIVQVESGIMGFVGLKADGTVLITGFDDAMHDEVESWTDIIQISAEYNTVAGLKSDGTVVTLVDQFDDFTFEVSDWTDIVHVCAGHGFILGVKEDGTVLSSSSVHRDIDVSAWADIIQISANQLYAVGLKKDGTVVVTDGFNHGKNILKNWTDITQVSAGMVHIVGLKDDGTVISTSPNSDIGYEYSHHEQEDVLGWEDVVYVSAGHWNTVALKSDGTVYSAGDNREGMNNNDWNLNKPYVPPPTPTEYIISNHGFDFTRIIISFWRNFFGFQ
jgi:hypothetical protein